MKLGATLLVAAMTVTLVGSGSVRRETSAGDPNVSGPEEARPWQSGRSPWLRSGRIAPFFACKTPLCVSERCWVRTSDLCRVKADRQISPRTTQH